MTSTVEIAKPTANAPYLARETQLMAADLNRAEFS